MSLLCCYLARAGFPDFYRVNLCSGLLTTINIQQDIIYMPLFSARTAEMLFWLCFFPAIPTQNLVLVLNLLIFISPQRSNYCDKCHTNKIMFNQVVNMIFEESQLFFVSYWHIRHFFKKSHYYGKEILLLWERNIIFVLLNIPVLVYF